MSNTPLIEVTNLSLKLSNADVLSSITIASTDPGVTMVMGPNGAGKSLFLRCLHGLTIPTGGSIKIFGNTYSWDIDRSGNGVSETSPTETERH